MCYLDEAQWSNFHCFIGLVEAINLCGFISKYCSVGRQSPGLVNCDRRWLVQMCQPWMQRRWNRRCWYQHPPILNNKKLMPYVLHPSWFVHHNGALSRLYFHIIYHRQTIWLWSWDKSTVFTQACCRALYSYTHIGSVMRKTKTPSSNPGAMQSTRRENSASSNDAIPNQEIWKVTWALIWGLNSLLKSQSAIEDSGDFYLLSKRRRCLILRNFQGSRSSVRNCCSTDHWRARKRSWWRLASSWCLTA